jgi:hypothetical protein
MFVSSKVMAARKREILTAGSSKFENYSMGHGELGIHGIKSTSKTL